MEGEIMSAPYTYAQMLEEIKADLAYGVLSPNSTIYIKRGEEKFGYRPIIDYFNNKQEDESFVPVNVQECIAELKEMSKIR